MNVLKSALLMAQFSASVLAATETNDFEPVLYGKGAAKCDDELPTLSVAADNLINTKAEWEAFTKTHPLFVVGAADSACATCCDSEPLLNDLRKAIESKTMLSFPEKNKKQKKIVRREIGLARVDLSNKVLVEHLADKGVWFPMGTTVNIGSGGRMYRYDGMYADFTMLAHHMQRIVNPVIQLTSEEEILSFLDNSESKIWTGDYSGSLLPKGQTFDDERRMDKFSKLMPYNTRVVAFFYDKAEYAEEIKILRETSAYLANRYNLRVGQVTDERLVSKMKKTHGDLFLDVGMSIMVLKRYDGTIHKLNLADTQPNRYAWWMTVKSTKAVDQLTPASFQLSESARMSFITIFVDFSEPVIAQKSQDLISTLERIAPQFEERYRFFWTDDPGQLEQRRLLGITWDELPALGINSLEHVVFAYPQDEPFEVENLNKWLTMTTLKKSAETDLRAKDFKIRQRDPTIYENFLEKTIKADRGTFNDVILHEDADSVLFIYSTENANYVQRKAAFQFNLVVEALSNEAWKIVGDRMNFYSYDAYEHAFPKGIPSLSSPPQDTRAMHIVSEEQRKSGLPAVYIFPAGQKNLPYTKFLKFPHADDLIDFIFEKSSQTFKVSGDDFIGLGKRAVDEQAFHRRIDNEGVIQLEGAFDEL